MWFQPAYRFRCLGILQGTIYRYVTFHFLVAVDTIITCEKKDDELFFFSLFF